jgi:hypothetical protein
MDPADRSIFCGSGSSSVRVAANSPHGHVFRLHTRGDRPCIGALLAAARLWMRVPKAGHLP